jgi:hypothetical protein
VQQIGVRDDEGGIKGGEIKGGVRENGLECSLTAQTTEDTRSRKGKIPREADCSHEG